jgi:hypothetical protein
MYIYRRERERRVDTGYIGKSLSPQVPTALLFTHDEEKEYTETWVG